MATTRATLRQLKTTFQAGELDPLMNMRSDVNAYINGAKNMQNVSLFSQGGFKRRNGTKRYASLTGDARLIGFDFDDNEQYIMAFGNERVDIYYLGDDSLAQSLTSAPWTSAILNEMQFSQAGDTMIVTHPALATQQITRTSLTSFTRSAYAFDTDDENVYQPYYKFASPSVTLSTNGTTGSVTVTASANHFTSDYVNTYIKIENTTLRITNYTSATQVTATILGTLRKKLITDPFTTENGTRVITVNDPLHGLVDSATIVVSGSNSIEGISATNINGSRSITVLDEDTYTFEAGGSTNASNTAAGGGTAVYITSSGQTNTQWKEQTFSTTRGYPASSTFHDGRLWFGGSSSQPDWVWASKVDQYFNFDVGGGDDSDSIQSSIGASQVADIRHLLSNRHLLIFTANGEFFCPQSDTSVLTPTNFQPRRQTTHGCSHVNVKTLEGGALFVQKHGKAVRELLFTDLELSYSATNVSVLASHLVSNPVDMSILQGTAERPESYAMFVNTDGTIGVFHAVRAEKLAGWTQWVSTPQQATCTITVTDYANIATGAIISLTKNDGTIVNFTCQGAGTGTPDTDKFFHNSSNNVTADNIFNCINAHDDFTVTNPAANVVTVTRNDVGNDNLTVTSTETTRLATTNFVNGVAHFKSVEAVGSRCFFTVYRNGSYFIEEMGDEANTLDHSSTYSIAQAGVTFTGLSNYASKTVMVRSGDFYMGEFTVTGGGSLTLSDGFDCNSITVGYDYTVDVETMPVETAVPSGSLQGKPKRVSKVVLGLDSALATTVTENKLVLRQVTDDLSLSPATVTGKKDFYLLGYNKDATVKITQDDPLPVRITGLVMEYRY